MYFVFCSAMIIAKREHGWFDCVAKFLASQTTDVSLSSIVKTGFITPESNRLDSLRTMLFNI